MNELITLFATGIFVKNTRTAFHLQTNNTVLRNPVYPGGLQSTLEPLRPVVVCVSSGGASLFGARGQNPPPFSPEKSSRSHQLYLCFGKITQISSKLYITTKENTKRGNSYIRNVKYISTHIYWTYVIYTSQANACTCMVQHNSMFYRTLSILHNKEFYS